MWWETKEVMVCQAASQTRFRALKHEYGIDGAATIIVRVIACFQPLHFCQVSNMFLIVGVFHLQFFSFYNYIFDDEACCFMKVSLSVCIVALDKHYHHWTLKIICLCYPLLDSFMSSMSDMCYLPTLCRLSTSVICLSLSRRSIHISFSLSWSL